MKIRMRENSVRMRLTRGEVQQLADRGDVEQRVCFGPKTANTLVYAVVRSDDAAVQATFVDGRIEVRIPKAMVARWAASEQVGFDVQQDATHSETLQILVEKDFRCLVPRDGEDATDAYPHPDAEA